MTITHNKKDDWKDPLQTFTYRLARWSNTHSILGLGIDHPIMESEQELLDMSRSRLQEAFLSNSLEMDEVKILTHIHDQAKSMIENLLTDAKDRDRAIEHLDNYPFDLLFKTTH